MATQNQLKGKRIVLEGNICAGKTSLINFLKANLNGSVYALDSGFDLFHPNPEINTLVKQRSNPKRWAFINQLNFMALFNDLHNSCSKHDYNIFNRSIFSVHNVFTQTYYHDVNYIDTEKYLFLTKYYKEMVSAETQPIDLLIFFTGDVKTLLSRSTTNTFKPFISIFQTYYERLLPIIQKAHPSAKVYIFDSNKTLEEIQVDYKNILNIINEL